MSSILSGFADAAAWMYTADGTIVGRARDRSYKEVARAGVPIDVFMETTAAPIESCIIQPVPYAEPARRVLDDEDLENFDQYIDLGRSKRRSILRARRVGGAKKPKHGPKASKARTVAAKIFAESLPVNDVTEAPAEAPATAASEPEPTQFHSALRAFLDDLDRLAQLLEADGFYLTEEEEAAERLMIRIRNSRYER